MKLYNFVSLCTKEEYLNKINGVVHKIGGLGLIDKI